MRPLLEDIRLLKLAEAREVAFIALLVDLSASLVRDRAALAHVHELLCAAQTRRLALARRLERLNARLAERRPEEVERAALMDLAEAARGDEAFHRDLAPRLHDDDDARLLRDLAAAKHREAAALDELAGVLTRGAPDAAGRMPPLPGRSTMHAPRPRETGG